MLSRARHLALTPLWVAQLATGAKSFGDNPIIGSPGLNRRGLHEARVALAHRLAAARRRRLAAGIAPADRTAFERDGFVLKPDFLPAADFAALRAEVAAYRGAAREMVQGDTVTRRLALDPPMLAALPTLEALLRRPDWLGIIRYVASSAAQPLFYLQTILSHVRPGSPDPQLELHADTFHPTVKAWFFLTDVAADAAPFTYVPGSHRLTPERLAWERRQSIEAHRAPDRLTRRGSFRIRASELGALGLPPPRAFAVPANTLIVADTFGFHARGASLRPSRRVEVWAYGRRSPFLPWSGLDPWSLLPGADWRVPLFWRFGDLVEAAGYRHNVWQPRPGRSAFDGPTGTPEDLAPAVPETVSRDLNN